MEVSFTVIVPAPPDMAHVLAVQRLREADFGSRPVEVLLVRGRNPSLQRNQAAAAAQGEVLYFMDDDCTAPAGLFDRVAAHYRDPTVAAVCGPNVPPPEESEPIHQAINASLTSRIAVFGKRAKFLPVGRCRPAADRHIILCNFSIRRSVFQQLGGFDVRLYPNEENEFLERLRDRLPGGAIYDPQCFVYRRRPGTIAEHFQKVVGYGRGRVRQLLSRFSWTSLYHVLPSAVFAAAVAAAVWGLWFWPALVPHGAYALLVLLTAAKAGLGNRSLRFGLLVALLVPLTHLAYVAGQARELAAPRRPRPAADPVTIEVIRPLVSRHP